MAILIDTQAEAWMTSEQFAEELRTFLPDADIRAWPTRGNTGDVLMLATAQLVPGRVKSLPNLLLVQKLGAGVESIVNDPDLGKQIRVTRLKPDAPAQEIAEYCVAYVLQHQRNMDFHRRNQGKRRWKAIAPQCTPKTVVGILGLGHIGSKAAQAFSQLGFKVMGWSRTAKKFADIECCHGDEALPNMLGVCDYVVSILPSTAITRNLFNIRMFSLMKTGSVFINVGRGDLVIEEDLLLAMDSGHIAGAVLDVFRTEPLPPDHPFWPHPNIIVTPHVSGWRITGGVETVAENYRRLTEGRPLLHEVDRSIEY